MGKKKTAPAKAVVAKKANPTTDQVVKNEVEAPSTTPTIVPESTKKLGRPVDPTSPRQIALAKAAAARAAGELKRGRPVVEGSKSHEKAIAKAIKVQEAKEALLASGTLPAGTKIEDITDAMVKTGRGRPVIEGSKHQQVLAMRAAKVANGEVLKPGRPKMVKVETPTTEAK